MKQTPIHNQYNPDLLALMPKGAARVVEAGCSSGALARAYKLLNPTVHYTGIEIDADYAAAAADVCDRIMVGDMEAWGDQEFDALAPVDCWVFGDVLEHFQNPWRILLRVAATLSAEGCVVACVPNMQHWSIQARLNSGQLQYEDMGLLDRTHLRWFTRQTVFELFHGAGMTIVEGWPRIFDDPKAEPTLAGVRAMAQAIGADPEQAVTDARALQYVVRAVPQRISE